MKSKEVIRVCPICANKSGELLHNQSFQLYEGFCLPDAYDVVCCKKCGFVYADTPATQKDYNDFYGNFSKYENSISPGGRINPCDLDKYERMTRDLGKLLKDKNASILDIGCAKGGLLSTLKIHGFNNLTGLDPSLSCVNQVKSQGINALLGGLFEENFSGTELKDIFDCVIISHVIEHVYDLLGAIKNAFSYVKSGGLLYLEVPDSARYTRYYIAPYHYFDFEHINHFDEHSLNNLMSHFSCEQVASDKKDVQHSNAVFYPAVYSVYRKKETIDKQQNIVPNFNVRKNVVRYIEMSRQADYWPELEDLVKTQEKIVVWGAAAYTSRVFKTSLLKKCNIVGFIDNDSKKQGAKFGNDVKIYPPKDLLPNFKGPIVVCSAVYNNEIAKEIYNMAISNTVIVLR